MRLKSKRLISLLLAGSMMVSMLPASAVTAFAETTATAVVAENSNTKTSDTCGATESDKVYWNYASGVLTISGTGAMADFTLPNDKKPETNTSPRPWEVYADQITEVRIADTVTKIGDMAFAGFTALKKVNIPAETKGLGNYIFSGDTALTTVTWDTGFSAPTTIKDKDSNSGDYTGAYVPTSMFDGCTSLGEGVELSTWLPKSFTGIGCAAFRGTAFTVDFEKWDNLTYIGAYAFASMQNLKSFTLSDKITIGLRGGSSNAFNGSKLEKMTIDVGTVPKCFATNAQIGELQLTDKVKVISDGAFQGSNLTELNVPKNVEEIGLYGFCGCNNLRKITLNGKIKLSKRAFSNNVLEEFVIADGAEVTSDSSAFTEYTQAGIHKVSTLKKLEVYGTLKAEKDSDTQGIWNSLFSPNESLTEVTVSGPNMKYAILGAFPYMKTLHVVGGDASTPGYSYSGNTVLQHVVIDATTYTSAAKAFRNAQGLETFTLKANNAKLDESTFAACLNLKAVDLTQCGSIEYVAGCFTNGVNVRFDKDKMNSSAIIYVKREEQNPRNTTGTGLSDTHGIVFVVGDGDVDVNKEGFDSVSKPGYATRWYTDSACTTALTAEEVKAGPQIGKTYYAAYKTLHTVTFDDGVNNSTVKVADGETVAQPADPKKDGYRFDGWYKKDAAGTQAFDFATETITTNTTVYAKWTPYKTTVEPKVEANADPVSKTVEITVNVEAAPAELAGATATLNFTDANGHDDSANVVEVKVNGTPVSKNADGKYTANLNDLMNTEKVPDASENGADAVMLADVNAGAVVPGMKNGTARLTVTYKTPGKHLVAIVLNAANGDVICKETATVEIAPEPGTLNLTGCTAKLEDGTEDGTPVENGAKVPVGAEVTVTFEPDADSDLVLNGWNVTPETLTDTNGKLVKDITADTFTFKMPETDEGVTIAAQTKTKAAAPAEDDSLDAATVVTGVVLGTGTAILAYHIGIEVYAEQVLGKGVAIPRTREEVALKAWELAGKPAVELNGEPLSEAAQAEKWAVESGLMQNVDGSFNGSKKMSKLKALRTLDAAKKLG